MSFSDLSEITLLSIKVSGLATLISLLIGYPFGTLLALGKFPGRSFLLTVVNTGMALPPVVVGLAVAMTLWRSGPLGTLHLIYTPSAIVIAQVVIAAPVVTGLTAAALQALDPRLRQQLYGLGASRLQMVLAICGQTRVLTTAIVLETSKGEFGNAIALGILLLLTTFLINYVLTWIQQKGARR